MFIAKPYSAVHILVFSLLTFCCSLTFAANPEKKPNNSWISVSGTVVKSTANDFWLDYGEGTIRVEMDDWDWYKEGTALIEDDKVTVNGYVDDDLYETKTIEASSVFVEGLNTYFYASGIDEEDYISYLKSFSPSLNNIELIGEITRIERREFMLDTGSRTVRIDTSELAYNPMDDLGYQKLKKGDWVKVLGEMDVDIFERREVEADRIVTLVNDQGKRSG